MPDSPGGGAVGIAGVCRVSEEKAACASSDDRDTFTMWFRGESASPPRKQIEHWFSLSDSDRATGSGDNAVGFALDSEATVDADDDNDGSEEDRDSEEIFSSCAVAGLEVAPGEEAAVDFDGSGAILLRTMKAR
jgi:hypothetical protein